MKFICDDNLGKLAGYLRILGFDTLFYEDIDDPSILRLAANESRILLTRDNKLADRSIPSGILILKEDSPLKQLSTVVGELKLTVNTDSLFTRCSKCNTPSELVDKNQLADKVFPYILKTQKIIRRCPSCGRYYWKGTHYKALLAKLRAALNDENIMGNWPSVDTGEV